MALLKRYRKPLLVSFGFAQLGYLLLLPATRSAIGLFVKAVAEPRFLPYVLAAPALLAGGVVFNRRLKQLGWRWLEWSPFHVRSNVALAPLSLGRLGLAYGVMLAGCIPLLAFFEELIFRNGTTGWVRGLLWGGLAFGAVHLVSFVTVRMTIYLSIVGVVLVAVYMSGGLVAVFVTHAAYNLLALTLLIAERHLRHAPDILRRLTGSLAAAN